MPRRRNLPVVERAELKRLPTKVLLARLQLLRECEDEPAATDLEPDELAAVEAAGGISFKCEPQWRAAYEDLKAVLATREHVPRPAERPLEPRGQRHGRTGIRSITSCARRVVP